MWQFIKDVWRFIRRRDSDSACCLIITLSGYLTDRDQKQMRDYLTSDLQFRAEWAKFNAN